MSKTSKANNNTKSQLYDGIRIVELVWTDAEEYGDNGWNDMNELLNYSKKPCPVMQSIGYVAFEDDDHISLISTVAPGVCGKVEKIPRGWIVRETIIRPGESLWEHIKEPKRERKERRGNLGG